MRIVIVEKDNTKTTREAAAKAALKLSMHIVSPVVVELLEDSRQILPWYKEREAIAMIEEMGNELQKV